MLTIVRSSTAMNNHKMQGTVDTFVKIDNNIRFSFSVTKTTCVHFCRMWRNHPDSTLIIKVVRLLYRPIIKFLGLTFDRYLTWNPYVDHLAARCKSFVKRKQVHFPYDLGSTYISVIAPVCRAGVIHNGLRMRGVFFSQEVVLEKAGSCSYR